MDTHSLAPPSPATEDLPLFPFTRAKQFQLPPEYAEAQATLPVKPVKLWNGQRAWLLTKHADFCSVILDPRFSGQFSRPNFPSVTEARRAIEKLERAFIGMDNPLHDHFRRMFLKEFTTKRMLALRPAIEKIADDILGKMERKGPPSDLVADLAVELPALVMCDLIGSPYEDHTYIAKCAAGRHGLAQSTDAAAQAGADLVAYCLDLIARKEAAPADDMVSRVLQAHVLTGDLSREDFANSIAMILRGGHDTTTNMIGLGTLLLLEHPDQLARLKSEPGLVDSAVEELLRFLTPVQFAPRRVALEDVVVNDTPICKGDGVFGIAAAANRDPEQFPNPDVLDLGRDAGSHLSFGYGIHRCIGQGLARLELQVVFSKLFAKFPNLYLAEPLESVPFKYDSQIYGLYHLQVGW